MQKPFLHYFNNDSPTWYLYYNGSSNTKLGTPGEKATAAQILVETDLQTPLVREIILKGGSESRLQKVINDNPPLECVACKRLQLNSPPYIYCNHAAPLETASIPNDKGKAKATTLDPTPHSISETQMTLSKRDWHEVTRRRRGRRTPMDPEH